MKFLLGTQEDFDLFLASITPDDRVGILTHDDLDGFTSAIILEELLKKRKLNLAHLDFVKWTVNAFDDIFSGLEEKKITKLFLTDLNVDSYPDQIARLRAFCDFLIIDHHSLNSEFTDTSKMIKAGMNDCAALMVQELSQKHMDVSRFDELLCATMVEEHSYKNEVNAQFIQERYADFSVEKPMESKPGKLAGILNGAIIYLDKNRMRAYELIKVMDVSALQRYSDEVRSEIERIVGNFEENAQHVSECDLYFYSFSTKFTITSAIATAVSVKHPKSVVILVCVDNDDVSFLKVSARNQSARMDMPELLRRAMKGFMYGVSGGHKVAAGGHFRKEDFEVFKKQLFFAAREMARG